MMPLTYHDGQIAVQQEANTRVIADRLANWVGPVEEFAHVADLLVLATVAENGMPRFALLSGAAPLVEVVRPSVLRPRFPDGSAPRLSGPVSCGGLAINLGQARRARLNGVLSPAGDGVELAASEAFTNCRKYMAPSLAVDATLHAGPVTRDQVGIDDAALAAVLAKAETAFLASISPDGMLDVSHRGGPPGFLALDAAAGHLRWDEFIGDGMFKSAGNVRATGTVALLVPDLDTGDGYELSGHATYTTIRTERRPRTDGLMQHREPFPIQGAISVQVQSATRLGGLMRPRRRIERAVKITSCSNIDDQAPQ